MMKAKSLTAWVVATLVILGGAGWVFAFVHEGKDAAIEAALPKLDLEKDPYVLREAWWHGELKDGETKLIQHQLFKRNDYWFWMGASNPDAKVNLHIYDAGGNLVEVESFARGHVAGARVTPTASGIFYIRIAVETGSVDSTEWAVIYAFK
jgi:hypothetical protein